MTISYLQAITINWPAVQCHAEGDEYTDLVSDSGDAIPSQEELDTWIAAHPNGLSGTKITKLAFRQRFTIMEKVGVEMACLDNPGASDTVREQSALVRVYIKDLDNASWVDLADQNTIDGVTLLESAGILATGRSDQILDISAITDAERFSHEAS